jgi:hypothetical protein
VASSHPHSHIRPIFDNYRYLLYNIRSRGMEQLHLEEGPTLSDLPPTVSSNID